MDLLSFHEKSGLPMKINEEKENTVGNSSPEESRDFPTTNLNNSFGFSLKKRFFSLII